MAEIMAGDDGMSPEAAQLAAIRAELASYPAENRAIVEALAMQLRDAVRRVPALLGAMALVSAEVLAGEGWAAALE